MPQPQEATLAQLSLTESLASRKNLGDSNERVLGRRQSLGRGYPRDFQKKASSEGHCVAHTRSHRIPTYILLLKPGVPPRETGLCTSGGSTLQNLRNVRPWSRSLGILSGSFQVGDLVSEPKFPHL